MPGTISISMSGGYVAAVGLTGFAVLAAFLFYRFTLPPLSPGRRVIFALCRGVALALLVLLLCEPLLRNIHHTEKPPTVAVVIDNSQSMSLRDGSGDRAMNVKQLLHKDQFRIPPTGWNLSFYTFSSALSLSSEVLPDSLPLDGETTDLSDALTALESKTEEENIRSVVLITDGDYTTGKNPLYAAEALRVPVYTVGVGDTADQKDVLIENIGTNTLVYAGERV